MQITYSLFRNSRVVTRRRGVVGCTKAIAFVSGLLALSFAPAALSQDEPTEGPTDQETEALALLNALRADPAGEGVAIAGLRRNAFDIPAYVDLGMFTDEMLAYEPLPPIVFNLKLLESARNHSRYMAAHGQGHGEEPGRLHFTGERFADRAMHVGYDYRSISENVFVAGESVHQSHVAFVIDWGWEHDEGGMQAGRGHRANMLSPRFIEGGIAVVPWKEDAASGGRDLLSVTHALAVPRTLARFVGGVVYVDENRNRRYDAGEGIGGVTITASDGSEATTWDSGAYTLELAGPDAVTIRAEHQTMFREIELGRSHDNAGFDWVLPARIYEDKIETLVAAWHAVDEGNEKMRRHGAISLFLAAQENVVPEALAEEVVAITAGIAEQIAEDHQAVIEQLFHGDPEASRQIIRDHNEPYRGTELRDWSRDAEYVRMSLLMVERLHAISEDDVVGRRQELRRIYRMRGSIVDPGLRALLDEVISR